MRTSGPPHLFRVLLGALGILACRAPVAATSPQKVPTTHVGENDSAGPDLAPTGDNSRHNTTRRKRRTSTCAA